MILLTTVTHSVPARQSKRRGGQTSAAERTNKLRTPGEKYQI